MLSGSAGLSIQIRIQVLAQTTSANLNDPPGALQGSKPVRRAKNIPSAGERAKIALVRRWYESTTGIRTITWTYNKPQAISPHPNQQIRGGKEMGPHAPKPRNEVRSPVPVELG
jgi:hypothetical protein